MRSQSAVNESAVKALGAVGMVRPSPTALQVIIGPVAEQIAGEMREALRSMPLDTPAPVGPAEPVAPADDARDVPGAPSIEPAQIEGLLAALGGVANIREIAAASSRLRIALADAAYVNADALQRLRLRGSVWVAPDCLHVIIGPAAPAVRASLCARLGSTRSNV